jgi:hypothetical protein
MAAGVHNAWVLGAVLHIVLFLYTQGVNIRPEDDNSVIPGGCAFDDPKNPGPAYACMGNAHSRKFSLNSFGCFEFRITRFRVFVKMPAEFNHVFFLLYHPGK